MSRSICWSLRWGNPYSEPPDGLPRVRLSIQVPAGTPCPAAIKDQFEPGSGWIVSWQAVDQGPIRRWSQEAKARVRQGNLRKRMERKFPLFAETFIEDELRARPEYFAAEDEDVIEN